MGSDTVVALHQWHTVDDLADLEGVSTRTIYRRLKRGDVEKRETSEGTRYRIAPDGTDSAGVSTDSHDTPTDVSSVSAPKGEPTDSGDSAGVSSVSGVSELTALVGELVDDVRALERENARLRTDLEHLRETVEPEINENTGTAEAKSEGGAPSRPDETSESAGDGCDMTAKEMVDLLRDTAND